MAKKLREKEGEFSFSGELIKNQNVEKEGAKSFREITIRNNSDSSEQSFRVYPSGVTRVWDNASRTHTPYEGKEAKDMIAKLTDPAYSGDESIISTYTLEGKQKTQVYSNDAFIDLISKIKPKSKVCLSGRVNYTEYQGRLGFPKFNLDTIKLLSVKEAKNSFDIFLPVLIAEEDKDSLVFTEDVYKKMNVLVLMKTESKEKKYAKTKITLNPKRVFSGDLYEKAMKLVSYEDYLALLNNKVFVPTKNSLKQTKGYVATRLHLQLEAKRGERPVTLDDLPMNEQEFVKAMQDLQPDKDIIKDYLKDKDLITVNAFDFLLQTVGLKKSYESAEFEEVKDGEIHLYDKNTNSAPVSTAETIVDDIVKDLESEMAKTTTETPKVAEPQENKEIVTKDEFDGLLEETNKAVEEKVVEKVAEKEVVDDDFPF